MSEIFLKYAYELGASLAEKNANEGSGILSSLSNAYDTAVDSTADYFQDLDNYSVGLADGVGDLFKGPAVSRGNRDFRAYQDAARERLYSAARRRALVEQYLINEERRPGYDTTVDFNKILSALEKPRRGSTTREVYGERFPYVSDPIPYPAKPEDLNRALSALWINKRTEDYDTGHVDLNQRLRGMQFVEDNRPTPVFNNIRPTFHKQMARGMQFVDKSKEERDKIFDALQRMSEEMQDNKSINK